jgi:hypothetical protein
MSEHPIQPWIAVNGYMDDEYREIVVNLALQHFPNASRELRAFAKRELSKAVTVAGFRSFDRAPVDVVRRHVMRQMERHPGVATAVVCLWAEAEAKSIDELQAAAEAKGLDFYTDWSWQEAREGFHDFDDVPLLTECTKALAQDRPSPEADHIWLATLWLSRALASEPSETTTDTHPQELEETWTQEVKPALPEPEAEPSSLEEKRETLIQEVKPTPPELEAELPPSLEEKPEAIEPAELAEFEETLPALTQALQEQIDEADQAHQLVLAKAQAVLEAVQASDLTETEIQLTTLQDALDGWKSERRSLKGTAERAAALLASELEVRPDLDVDTSVSAPPSTEEPAGTLAEAAARSLLFCFEHILEYDQEKQDVLSQLDQVRATIVELNEDITGWMQGEAADTPEPAYPAGEELEIALADARAILEQTVEEQHKLETRRSQLRELSLNRITNLVAELQEYDLPADTPVGDNLTLGALASSDLTGWDSRPLWSLEQSLVKLNNEQMIKTQSTAPDKLVAELRSDWNDDKFVDLLGRMAEEKRDVEVLLLTLAANAAHPRTQTVSLASPVVSSLLRGIGQLSSKAQPFELLNSLAPGFLNGWEAAEPKSQAELCLVFLTAQYSGGRRLPDGFLWQLPVEWPVDRMEDWSRIWQTALRDEPLPAITRTEDDDRAERLEQARAHAEQMLAREHGIFVRLSSLRSGRHAALLRDTVMPDLLSHLVALQGREEQLQSSNQYNLSNLLAQLDGLLSGDLAEALNEETLTKAYEAGAAEEGIIDDVPFHRRTALRILQDCADSILDYGQALVAYWRAELQADESVYYEALQSELATLPELTPLGQAALDQIVLAVGRELPEWNEAQAQASASQQLVHELLTQAAYLSRLPRIVGHLTGARLNWKDMLEYVLDDLAEPVDATGAASLLLEQEAPNQVLLLTQYVSLDIQKQAQALKRDKEREIERLQTELLKAGGNGAGLSGDLELGRWRLVHRELALQLDEIRLTYEAKRQQFRDRARQIRRTVNSLDETIFDSKGTMPTDVYRLVEKGLNLAKRATETEGLLDQVDAYIREIRYRLEHQSWPLAELQNVTDHLERAVAGESAPQDADLTAEDVLDLLERGELRQLNLNPDEVTTSEIGTRCDLLRNWLSVRALSSFMSEDLKAADRTAIQALFRYFARMVAMRRHRAPDDKPIIFEYPAVYSYWELQYPKTAVLENQCILIALTGQPPSAQDLSQLEYLLEDKEWLDYFFVFLFIPGCTAAIHKRFRSSYQGRGLVIIDESAILNMVLAEADSSNPLGQLRPLMLNALGAENVDVFKVNQLVDSRTAIFVGREALINRIASSGDNYAVYGGRRIGKSSVLMAVENRLKYRGVGVASFSFEGGEFSDDTSAMRLAQLLRLNDQVQDVGDFSLALQAYLDARPDLSFVLLLDEIDRYIEANTKRHVLIEALRAMSDRYGSRFRVVVAGFMSLYDCLRGRGPYTPTSDPWRRMLNDIGPLENLRPASAERIAREGFGEILGWKFENRAIPQRIVELTGGHPAFVQHFCMKLQQRVGRRGDRLIRLEDVEAIFADRDPEQSFIAYIRNTLGMNLDPVGHYLILWLIAESSSEKKTFTLDEMREIAASVTSTPIPEEHLQRSLERLSVTSVVKESVPQVYEFSVPDYPSILDQLGETAHLERLENELEEDLVK